MLVTLILLIAFIVVTVCREGYDSSNVQFHPSGRILLTEYAKEVVSRGGPIAAVKVEEGIILAAARPKLRSKLQLSTSKKVLFVDKHICVAGSGYLQTLEPVVRLARKISLNHRSIFDAPIPVEKLCNSLASVLHTNTIAADARRPVPLGLIVAGVDDALGCQLYSVDPEGSVHGWNAVALGKMSDDLMKSLSDLSTKKSAIKSVWPWFRSRVLSILKKKDIRENQSKINGFGLSEDQQEFRNEYLQHHSEVPKSEESGDESSEWDIEVS